LKYIAVFIISCSLFISCSNNNNNSVEVLPRVDTVIDYLLSNENRYSFDGLIYLDSALQSYTLSTRELIRVYAYKSAVLSIVQNDYDAAQLYTDSMLHLLEHKSEKKYAYEYSLTYYAIGDIHYKKNNFSQANYYYFKAADIFPYTDPCKKAFYSYRIGMLLYKQENYEASKTYFNNALQEIKCCKPSFNIYYKTQEIISNIGLCNYKLNLYDSAIYYYKKALNHIEQNKQTYTTNEQVHKIAQGVIYGNYADVLKAKKYFKAADSLYKLSITINSNKGSDVRDAQLTYLKLGEIYLEQNQADSVEKILNKVAVLQEQYPFLEAKLKWAYLNWIHYKNLNQINKAYNYLATYTTLKDSAYQVEKRRLQINIEDQNNSLLLQKEVAALQDKEELNQFLFLVGIIVAASVTIIIILLFYANKKAKHNLQQLEILNKTIQEQNKNLQQTNTEKDKLIKFVAHDLRAPITSIYSLANFAATEKNEAVKQELINTISQACTNALNLITELLNTKETKGLKQEINILNLLEECKKTLQHKTEPKNIIIQTPLQKDADKISIITDATALKRVLINLLDNAIKYSNSGSSINFYFSQNNTDCIFYIEDNGIGIPEALQPTIFSKPTNRKGTANEETYGLGLAICKKITEELGGRIWFSSKENIGTTFYVAVPMT
jgi:signal transduction histidine kinase